MSDINRLIKSIKEISNCKESFGESISISLASKLAYEIERLQDCLNKIGFIAKDSRYKAPEQQMEIRSNIEEIGKIVEIALSEKI